MGETSRFSAQIMKKAWLREKENILQTRSIPSDRQLDFLDPGFV